MSKPMPHDIALLTLADRREWEELEAREGTPSQCWRFAAALAGPGYEPRLAIVEAGGSRMVLPFVERTWRGQTDITTLPGLSGASIRPASAAPLERWHEFAADQGWVAGYIRLCAESYPNVPPEANPVHDTHAFLVDVPSWDRDCTPSLIIRRKLRMAGRAGAVIADDRPALVHALQRLYPATLERFGAKPSVSAAALEEWSRDPRTLLIGVTLDGTIEGVHLIHVDRAHAELHIVGVSDRGRTLSALLFTAAIERLKELGVASYNTGGGGEPGDGLYGFKTWLGGRPVPLQSIRQVYDEPRYASLCALAGADSTTEWFPVYRSIHRNQTDG